jgi:Tol biopolymer transport system component
LAAALLLAFVMALLSPEVRAMCDVIPGVESEFRGALGSVNRPYAIPGDEGEQVTLTLDPSDCDAASPGFLDLPGGTTPEDGYFVTVLFTPPQGGARNAVVLATADNESTCLEAVADAPTGVTATCRAPEPGGTPGFEIESASKLVFRFPDTDAEFAPDDDDRTFSGPVAIAVTPASSPLPFALAAARCAETPGLVACVDELYARDGTCANTTAHIDPLFGQFTALPPANDYQALCTTTDPGAPCTGLADELRFTIDAAGNALVPMDYRGVLVQSDRIPIPRLILGDTGIEAFSGSGAPVALPTDGFLASYSPGGHRLPPVFTPLSKAGSQLSLFGSVDAPVGVIRVTRQGCVGGETQGAPCSADAQCGLGATCEELFDFSDRLLGGVGPVLIARGEFDLQTQNPVPLDGLIESESMFAFVENEAIEEKLLNDDSDSTDPVLRLRDRLTATILPIGTGGADGRAATRVKNGRFRFPAVAVEGDIAAFLELEPLEGYRDTNANRSVFDPILRVYRIVQDCGGGSPCAEEITASLPKPIAVDAAPLVEGRSVAISDGLVYFRIPEWRQAQQVTERVSVASNGGQANRQSNSPSLSSDGRVVAFHSFATNLVPGDTNGSADAFVHDRATGETERVSVASDGTQGDWDSWTPSLSSDGQVVAFGSTAGNLVPGDSILCANFSDPSWRYNCPDVFVHDRATQSTEVVSVGSDGAQGNNRSYRPSLSSEGRVVAFESQASNLVPGDTQLCADHLGNIENCSDVFVHDHATGATKRLSVGSDGAQGNNHSFSPSLSSDGRVVAFHSHASNLVPGDTNSSQDVFAHDRATGETKRVSIASDGGQGYWDAGQASLSSDGRVVGFLSVASDLVPGDTNAWGDAFVHDRATGETERVSVASDGGQGDLWSGSPSLSSDGRVVVFRSGASNLAPGDTNSSTDVFVHDHVTGATGRVSVASDGNEGNSDSCQLYPPSLSSDGRVVAFESYASNLVPGDTNGDVDPYLGKDIFVRGPDETDLTSDLSGDGDLQDTLLGALDAATGVVTPLCPAEQVAVSEGSAALLRPMAAGPCATGAGLGAGEGDPDDLVVHLFVPGQGMANLGRAATAVALSGDLVGALVRGGSGGSEAQAYDRAGQGWLSTGEAADSVAVAGTTLTFTSPEADVGADRNGDGDLLDRVVRIFRLEGGALVALSGLPAPAAEELVLGERLVAFRTREASQGEDLNGDGDLEDDVLQVFDLESRRLFNTEQAVTPCPLEACDPRFPYRVDGDAVTFITSEAEQGGEDLSGDGDAGDLVKQVFNAREAALLAPVSGEAAEFVDAIAAASAGICTTTGAACASDADCGEGSCYLPPGGCIADLGTSCTCGDSGCFGCAENQFCVPFPGGGGAGTCHVNQGPCASQDDCAAPAVCEDAKADVQRLFAPISGSRTTAGGETIISSGACVEDRGDICSVDADCRPKETCGSSGICQRRFGSCRTDADCRRGLTCAPDLVTVNAADTDGDSVVDPFDNCPHRANADQADENGNGVGDACDLSTLVTRVLIDIKPGSVSNPVNPFSRGVVPVALLGSEQFDIADVDRSSLAFGPDRASPVNKAGGKPQDVNGDGLADLLIHFRVQQTGISLGDTEACLIGETVAGIPFEGCDAITTMPSCGLGYELGALLPLLLALQRRIRGRHSAHVEVSTGGSPPRRP